MAKENINLHIKPNYSRELKLKRLIAFEDELLRTEWPDWNGVLTDYTQHYLNSSQEGVEFYKEKLLLIIDRVHDKKFNRRIVETVRVVKDKPNDGGVPWRDVALSMLRKPHEVKFDGRKCPECGKPMTELFFVSCYWSSFNMCAIKGPMVICPDCQVQQFTGPVIRS